MIGNVNFDGSANIVPQTIQTLNESVNPANYLLFSNSSGTANIQPKNNLSLTYNAATSTLSAPTLAATSGNISGTSTSCVTVPALSGDVSTTGTSNTTTIGASKVTNSMLAGSIADTKLNTISTSGKVANTATTADSKNTASAIVARDGSGNFSAGTITAALTGNSSTATKLQTARNINGVSFDGSADVTVPTSTITTTAAGNKYLLFVPANSSSNQNAYVNSAIQYDPGTTTLIVDNINVTYGIYSSGGFSGSSISLTNDLSVNGGFYMNSYQVFGCKAFCQFNGTLTSPITPTVQGNVSSVTRPATGIYKISFTNALPSANYMVQVTCSRNGVPTGGRSDCSCGVLVDSTPTYTGRTTTYCHVFSSYGSSSYYNDADVNIMIIF
jgi:hypothetical protein